MQVLLWQTQLQSMAEVELMFGWVEMILPMKEIGHGMEKMKAMEFSFGMVTPLMVLVKLVAFLIIGGTANGPQIEPDDFNNSQDALAMSVDGWPLGSAGEWNDLDENNTLYFVVEYNSTINDVGLASWL